MNLWKWCIKFERHLKRLRRKVIPKRSRDKMWHYIWECVSTAMSGSAREGGSTDNAGFYFAHLTFLIFVQRFYIYCVIVKNRRVFFFSLKWKYLFQFTLISNKYLLLGCYIHDRPDTGSGIMPIKKTESSPLGSETTGKMHMERGRYSTNMDSYS